MVKLVCLDLEGVLGQNMCFHDLTVVRVQFNHHQDGVVRQFADSEHYTALPDRMAYIVPYQSYITHASNE